MKTLIPRLFRQKQRRTVQLLQPAGVATSPSIKSADDLCNELRARFGQTGNCYFEFGEIVADDAVADCRVFANRHLAVESLPKGGIVAEVGTQTGHFANHIFKVARPSQLHLFDLSLEWFDSGLLVEPIHDGSVQIHLGDSATELSKFPAEHFDWLYIDGDHSYRGVTRDIAQAVRTVKRDGLLVFNDYTVWSPLEACNYGVLKAVNELVNSGEWEFVYIALHPWGYHDAALRRREAHRTGRDRD
jgi:SAM-dependent methyltransferase